MANYSSFAMVNIDTHSNPLSSDLDHELLYALAWMQSRQEISEQTVQLGASMAPQFRDYLSKIIRDLEFGRDDMLQVIAHLRRGENYRSLRAEWHLEEGMVHVWGLLASGKRFGHRGYVLAPEMVIAELESLLTRYEEAKTQGVTIEKGLLPFLGGSTDSEHIVLEVLARTQHVASPDVAKCWWMVVGGIQDEWAPLSGFESFVTKLESPQDFGAESFWLRIIDDETYGGGLVAIYFFVDSCSCSLVGLISEFQNMIQRFYASAER